MKVPGGVLVATLVPEPRSPASPPVPEPGITRQLPLAVPSAKDPSATMTQVPDRPEISAETSCRPVYSAVPSAR